MKDVLGDKVEKVIVSEGIDESPCIQMTGEYGWTAVMERIMRAQSLRDPSWTNYMASKKTMDINIASFIVQELLKKTEQEKNDKNVKDLIWLLFETSLSTAGFTLIEKHLCQKNPEDDQTRSTQIEGRPK